MSTTGATSREMEANNYSVFFNNTSTGALGISGNILTITDLPTAGFAKTGTPSSAGTPTPRRLLPWRHVVPATHRRCTPSIRSINTPLRSRQRRYPASPITQITDDGHPADDAYPGAPQPSGWTPTSATLWQYTTTMTMPAGSHAAYAVWEAAAADYPRSRRPSRSRRHAAGERGERLEYTAVRCMRRRNYQRGWYARSMFSAASSRRWTTPSTRWSTASTQRKDGQRPRGAHGGYTTTSLGKVADTRRSTICRRRGGDSE